MSKLAEQMKEVADNFHEKKHSEIYRQIQDAANDGWYTTTIAVKSTTYQSLINDLKKEGFEIHITSTNDIVTCLFVSWEK